MIPVTCSSCGNRLEFPNGCANSKVRCSRCRSSIAIPSLDQVELEAKKNEATETSTDSSFTPDVLATLFDPNAPDPGVEHTCANCNEKFYTTDEQCPHCGERLQKADLLTDLWGVSDSQNQTLKQKIKETVKANEDNEKTAPFPLGLIIIIFIAISTLSGAIIYRYSLFTPAPPPVEVSKKRLPLIRFRWGETPNDILERISGRWALDNRYVVTRQSVFERQGTTRLWFKNNGFNRALYLSDDDGFSLWTSVSDELTKTWGKPTTPANLVNRWTDKYGGVTYAYSYSNWCGVLFLPPSHPVVDAEEASNFMRVHRDLGTTD